MAGVYESSYSSVIQKHLDIAGIINEITKIYKVGEDALNLDQEEIDDIVEAFEKMPVRKFVRLFLDVRQGVGRFKLYMLDGSHERACLELSIALTARLSILGHAANNSEDCGLIHQCGKLSFVGNRKVKQGDNSLMPRTRSAIRGSHPIVVIEVLQPKPPCPGDS
ncbi:hypothetical protein C8J56DRAFT_1161777 [Mycena floridula]|nr:hypothetical protein C8J56DRAFT_1161777 [Mycena floridula]